MPAPPRLRETTRDLIRAITLDVWPRNGAVVDFGLNSQDHYEALYYPLKHGDITPQQVDAALGNGKMLTELVNSAPHNPHKGIEFHTGWDGLLPEPESSRSSGNRSIQPTLSEIAAGKAVTSPGQEAGTTQEKDGGFEL